MKTLYFDVLCGASGDMILSSLIDVGVPEDFLRKELTKLAIPGFSMSVDKQKRSGIDCSHLTLSWDGLIKQVHSHADHDHAHEHHHDDHHHGGHGHGHHEHESHHHAGQGPLQFRNARQILEIIKKADYNERIYSSCEKILGRISEAEAAVHGVSVDDVHFHEIGAIDTIIDVAGISLCLDYLNVNELRFSTLTDGRGTVHTRHGLMPVPVPATAKLCEGFALKILDIESELLTPTGCGVLTALGKQAGPGPSGPLSKPDMGAGIKYLKMAPMRSGFF